MSGERGGGEHSFAVSYLPNDLCQNMEMNSALGGANDLVSPPQFAWIVLGLLCLSVSFSFWVYCWTNSSLYLRHLLKMDDWSVSLGQESFLVLGELGVISQKGCFERNCMRSVHGARKARKVRQASVLSPSFGHRACKCYTCFSFSIFFLAMKIRL